MRTLLPLTVIAVLTLSITSCGGDSSTGPDPDPGNGNGGGEATTYSVAVTSTPSEGGTTAPSDTTVDEGTELDLQANPADGYQFTHWSGDVDSTADNPLSLTASQDYELTAHFTKKNYALTVNTEGEGTVTEQVVQKSKDYEHGTVVELTATAAEGWQFIEWQGALTGTDNPEQITVDQAKDVTAVFEKTFYVTDNGVTIKCPGVEVGDSFTIDGTTYTKRSADQIDTDNAPTTCTSGITDMSEMFRNASNFNGNISHWDVSSVTDMTGLFYNANSFDGSLTYWDVSNVTDMRAMFYNASSLSSINSYLGDWDVSNVTDMDYMFSYTSYFDQDLSGWCVKKISSKPTQFANGSALQSSNFPNWGTCPQ